MVKTLRSVCERETSFSTYRWSCGAVFVGVAKAVGGVANIRDSGCSCFFSGAFDGDVCLGITEGDSLKQKRFSHKYRIFSYFNGRYWIKTKNLKW